MSYNTTLSTIKLEKSLTSDTESERHDTQVHYLEITAVAVNNGDDPNIFVHQLEPADPNGNNQISFFTNVCTPADYNELPSGEPGSGDDYTVFRTDTIKHFSRSHEELDTLYKEVEKDTQDLLDAFDRSSNLNSNSVTL